MYKKIYSVGAYTSLVLSKTVDGYLYEEFIYCGCGCQKTRSKYNSQGKLKMYLPGHQNRNRKPFSYGKHLSEEHRKKIGKAVTGENNGMFGKLGELSNSWKGENAGYFAIHDWMRKYFPKPDKCQMCLKSPPKELANITGIINREKKNWAYFCSKCHKYFDNIIERNLIIKRKKKKLVNPLG